MSPFFREYGNAQGLINVFHLYMTRKKSTDSDGQDIDEKCIMAVILSAVYNKMLSWMKTSAKI